MVSPINQEIITQTVNIEKNDEFVREAVDAEFKYLLKCQHLHVIQVYAKGITENGDLLIVIECAENGDLDAYYKKVID
jgi:hypothetical protein